MTDIFTGLALAGVAVSTAAWVVVAKLRIGNGERGMGNGEHIPRAKRVAEGDALAGVGTGRGKEQFHHFQFSIFNSKFSIHTAAFVFFATIATLSAQKTNSSPVRMMAPPLDMQPPPTVSPTDVARGYRLDCEFTSAAYSYAMPANGARYSNWWLRGAYEDVFRLDLGGMAFPLADEALVNE